MKEKFTSMAVGLPPRIAEAYKLVAIERHTNVSNILRDVLIGFSKPIVAPHGSQLDLQQILMRLEKEQEEAQS